MKAVVRHFHSPDVDLESFVPADPTEVGVLIQMMVGSDGDPGEDSFDVVVCTVSWLAREVRREGQLLGRHYLVVERFSVRDVEDFLRRQVEQAAGKTWEDVAAKVGRIGHWEFEDYQPYAGPARGAS